MLLPHVLHVRSDSPTGWAAAPQRRQMIVGTMPALQTGAGFDASLGLSGVFAP